MPNDIDPQGTVSTAGDRFPFVMVLTTTFLLGAIFVLTNGPLIVVLVKGNTFSGARSMLTNGLMPIWDSATQSAGGISSSFLFLALSLVVGLLLTPFARALTIVSIFIWERLKRLRLLRRFATSLPAFTSLAFADPAYTAMLAWLITRREAKLHWEWELFNYYVFWSVFTNVAICIALLSLLLSRAVSLVDLLIFAAAACVVGFLFFLFAAAHSDVMTTVHEHYRQQFLKAQLLICDKCGHKNAQVAVAQLGVAADAHEAARR